MLHTPLSDMASEPVRSVSEPFASRSVRVLGRSSNPDNLRLNLVLVGLACLPFNGDVCPSTGTEGIEGIMPSGGGLEDDSVSD